MNIKFNNSPIKYEVDEIKNTDFFQELGLSVLTPINDGEEFVYRFMPEGHLSLFLDDKGSFIGRSHGDLYPHLKEFSYNIFRRVLKTKKPEKIISSIYENNVKVFVIGIKVLYVEEEICTYNEDLSEQFSSKNELYKLLIANNYVQKATKTAIHFHDNRGVYHWTPEVYNLIEREPREDDATYHIL